MTTKDLPPEADETHFRGAIRRLRRKSYGYAFLSALFLFVTLAMTGVESVLAGVLLVWFGWESLVDARGADMLTEAFKDWKKMKAR